jgi:hypothetical protein
MALAIALTPVTASMAMTRDIAGLKPIAAMTAMAAMKLSPHHAATPCHGKPEVPSHDHAAACCPVCTASAAAIASMPVRALVTGAALAPHAYLSLSGRTIPPPDDPPRS